MMDWTTVVQGLLKNHKSSGFHPYLTFFAIECSVCMICLWLFSHVPLIQYIALSLMALTMILFLVLYCIKAFNDPDFCRSESHVQQMTRLDIEKMGHLQEFIDAAKLTGQPRIASENGNGDLKASLKESPT